MGDPQEETTHYDRDPSWALEVAEFADAILRNGRIINGSGEDALKTMQLVYKIYCADPQWRDKWGLERCDLEVSS